MQQRYGLQGRFRATLTETTPSHAEAEDTNGTVSKPVGPSGRGEGGEMLKRQSWTREDDAMLR
jgi:hypothetical protein